jgi:hypothetical protein
LVVGHGTMEIPIKAEVMDAATTTFRILTPKFRYIVFILSLLLSVVLGWSSLTAEELLPRICWGLCCMGFSGLLILVFQDECSLANSHLCVTGQAISLRRTRRSIDVRYSYFAPDGCKYEKNSHLGKWREFQEGKPIRVLVNPLRPDVSKPLASFIFYRFVE